MLFNRNNKKDDGKDEINKKIEIDKQDFWLLVKSAYTLFLTKVILK